MPCFDLAEYNNLPALIDGDSGRTLSYQELDAKTRQFASQFPETKSLIFLFIQSNLDSLTAYLALLNQGHAIALFDGSLDPDLKRHLITLYHPHYIIVPSAEENNLAPPNNYQQKTSPLESLTIWQCKDINSCPKIHPDLSLLLSTSGTTGSPKLIRLSKRNIVSNAEAICTYLIINKDERAIVTLPFHYSYGLSVLHSHLLAGASVVLTSQSIIQESFWKVFNEYHCTSLAGVPYTYQLLDRLDLDKIHVPSLHTLTQAGGRLSPTLITKFHHQMQKRHGRFFTMYGQTEATARITYLPFYYLPAKTGAIGIAIPNGKLQLFDGDDEVLENHREGELVYSGPNVMLGYAARAEDLEKGDEQHGVLRTGDLGYRDQDGIYFLTGRLKRISKVYGQRINLEEIEMAASKFGRFVATSDDTTIRLFYETADVVDIESCITFLSNTYHLSPSTFQSIPLARFPLTASDKIDYKKLNTMN